MNASTIATASHKCVNCSFLNMLIAISDTKLSSMQPSMKNRISMTEIYVYFLILVVNQLSSIGLVILTQSLFKR